MGKATGLRITRLFTKPGEDPLDSVTWGIRDSRIANPDGSVVFEMKDAEVPAGWSQVAADILVSKYLRKAGVPQFDESGEPIRDDEGRIVLGPERSARQVIRRLASTWRWWGERSGYFASEADARAFEDELAYMLVNQMAAPNSPQWFNTGLHHAYGLTGPAQGFWYVDPATGRAVPSPDSYSRPAPHACFIQSIEDDLVNEGGIMDLWVREARLFKFGAGTGTNFSRIRAENEPLSGGGRSSGVMSFLKIGDRAAGAIKSGGTTRRAAKMVILDIDHPDIEEFINWKKGEEEKVRALIAAGYSSDFNGEAYQTVAGQNANNSVRVSNEFVRAVLDDGDWHLTGRTNGTVMRTVRARQLWREIAEAAWACADPGVQFHTTINEWHTCPAGGPIRASNPCSEYMFLDNTACNLASLNLGSFFDDDSGTFNIEAYQHAVRLWTIVLEISVTMAHFPSREIAQGSYDYRTLGLGYANLGSLLMRSGIAYDSDEGRAIAAALTALLTGVAYSTSAEMASVLGPFARFDENRADMLRVIRNHRRAAYDAPQEEYEGISHRVVGIDPLYCPGALLEAARRAWDSAVDMGEQYGYRNAQTTCLAPTGTIGLQMDCDTTGVEPDFALVKFKKLAGGGYFKIANQSVDPALRSLGYSAEERSEMVRYVVGTMALEGAPHVDRAALVSLGLTDEEVDAVERALPGVFEVRHAFSPYVIGEDALARLGVDEAAWKAPGFDLLRHLGFTDEQVREAGDHICGRQTIEGAPHLRPEHLPVFDTANRNGRYGTRFIHHTGHIKAMAAVQPFITGAISKTINAPHEATVAEIEEAYLLSWQLGLKAMALYRDGSKASQPLSVTSDEGHSPDEEPVEVSDALETQARVVGGYFAPGVSPSQAYKGAVRPRFVLPSRRRGWTQEARVGGHKIFLRTGEYADGTLGELFIDLAKEGATLRGILSCFAIAVSKGLQYGVPLEEFVDTFTFHTFEPRGIVEGHPNIKMANSIVDYVFRALGLEYLGRTDLVQVPPADERELPEPPKGLAVDAGLQLSIADAAPSVMEQTAPISHPAVSDRRAAGHGPVAEGNGHRAPTPVAVPAAGGDAATAQALSVQWALGSLMGGAPLCDVCGHITVRNGTCYKCLNCGNSMGCS
ncbi:MAG TPA: vitamin B12-dependent ribonucleotide reductase [Acidimicrobiia bacterium]|nr:vitamin B12-dependent ribonucleotide reductase [Acidimicrobiia bacterium]